MKTADFLKAFGEMSSEDQEAIRAELWGKAASQETRDPMAMCHGLVEKMKAGGNPMAIFLEMAEKKKGECC